MRAKEHANAILDAFYPGEEGGAAVAETLSGRNNPAGRLPVTFYTGVDQLPDFENYSMKGRTYRYFEGKPLYPFGYGLSYTTFSYDNLRLSSKQAKVAGKIDVTVDVTNTGARSGDAVVQLYIHQRAGSASRPVRQLKGFERVSLDPRSKRTVHFVLSKAELEFWSPAKKAWVVEPERFDVWVGGDSTATLHDEFQLTP